mgnify:FL=1
MKTVKEMSRLSGVSVRTLHYYDEINLLTSSFIADNGYRYYNEDAIKRLQEILLFHELEFPLKTIKEIVGNTAYDRDFALQEQIKLLEMKKAHLKKVIKHAKSLQEKGDSYMKFDAYDKTELKALQKEAKQRWGKTAAYQKFAAKMSDKDFAHISSEMSAFGRLKQLSADHAEVQQQVESLRNYISQNFYACNKDILARLGKMYTADNRFSQTIDTAGGQEMAAFVAQAITAYCR